MNKPPAFQFYAQDFLTGVMYLTNEEIGIYIKMLAKQWTDGAIPKKRVGLLVGIEWDNLSEELKEKFIEIDGSLLNERLEKERQKKSKFIEKQSKNGAKGGRPPKNKKPKRNPNETQTQSQKKPLEEEDEVEKEKEVEKGNKVNNYFKSKIFKTQWDLWKVYRKKNDSFKFLNNDSENRKLTELKNLSKGNEDTAIKIIQQSIDNGWKGFFELKNKVVNSEKVIDKISKYD